MATKVVSKWVWKEEAAKGSVFTPMIHIIYISHHILYIHPTFAAYLGCRGWQSPTLTYIECIQVSV